MIVNKSVVKILQNDQIKSRSCDRDYTLDKWNFLYVKMSAAAIIDLTADYLGKFIHIKTFINNTLSRHPLKQRYSGRSVC